jgi:hypothetical protein
MSSAIAMRLCRALTFVVLVLAAIAGAPGRARAEPVDLELVLAVDVSRSIDAFEFDLQRRGYGDAFRSAQVLDAIRSGARQRIAVTLVEWAGAELQAVIVDWALIDDAVSAVSFADAVLYAPRPFAGWTSISGAIDFAAAMFVNNNYEGARLDIDVSGDGINNSGRAASLARDAAVANGITINGLVILNDRPNPVSGGIASPVTLDEFYLAEVIGGSGAFLMTVSDFRNFAQAVTAKLLREIAGEPPPGDLAARD